MYMLNNTGERPVLFNIYINKIIQEFKITTTAALSTNPTPTSTKAKPA